MFWEKLLNALAQKILYGGYVVFLYYILNKEMINYSCVSLSVFTEHFPETFKWKFRTKITNKSSSFDRGCGFKTLIIWICNWLDTEGESPTKSLIMTFYHNLLFNKTYV